MKNKKNTLAEVFGYLPDDHSEEAKRYRKLKLCPFNNIVPMCTKDKADDPLGVCSIHSSNGDIAVLCPVRFRQNWLIHQQAADFFFPKGTKWIPMSEIRLVDKDGIPAGNIDSVLVSYNKEGKIQDFGALEVQAVYVSGNIRNVFNDYMRDPAGQANKSWGNGNPHPDYLSSSRKRLAPQLMYKGSILHAWKKKMAIAVHSAFFNTLPKLPKVDKSEAELAWFVYDLVLNEKTNQYVLTLTESIYTKFESALGIITTGKPGAESEFVQNLQQRLKEKLASLLTSV